MINRALDLTIRVLSIQFERVKCGLELHRDCASGGVLDSRQVVKVGSCVLKVTGG